MTQGSCQLPHPGPSIAPAFWHYRRTGRNGQLTDCLSLPSQSTLTHSLSLSLSLHHTYSVPTFHLYNLRNANSSKTCPEPVLSSRLHCHCLVLLCPVYSKIRQTRFIRRSVTNGPSLITNTSLAFIFAVSHAHFCFDPML
jgi:hypothetical protein